jgi:hypothetical protein
LKEEEKIAYDYFITMGFKKIYHEPDGNIPPDFLLNESIAVEVRRLNQHFNYKKDIPIEKLEYQLIPRVTNLLKSFKVPDIDSSAFLTFSYARPLKVDKKLLSDIRVVLRNHLQSIKEVKEYRIRENLTVRIWPSKRILPNIYHIGILSDQDTGGFIISLIYQNLKLVIDEKNSKIKPYFNKYDEWWLLLIDRIGYTLHDEEINRLISIPLENYYFKKVILISGFDHNKVVTINKI